MKVLAVFVLALGVCMGANILEKADELGASTLLSFLTMAGLNATLESPGPFTVFAPNNGAFAALPPSLVAELEQNMTLLNEVLTYHVVSGNVMSTDLSNEMLADSVAGPKIRINIYGEKVLATGSEVILADQMADNGVIHVVNKVMMAPAGNIAEIAQSEPSLSTLVTALTTAGIVPDVEGGNLTVFAPTNDAFAEVENLDDILADVELLTKILTFHVAPATVYSAGLSNNQEITTLEGSKLKITISGNTVMAGEGTVTTADISALNGVVHVINKVLIPPEENPNSALTLIPSLATFILAALAFFA